jgi:hypothetical protein
LSCCCAPAPTTTHNKDAAIASALFCMLFLSNFSSLMTLLLGPVEHYLRIDHFAPLRSLMPIHQRPSLRLCSWLKPLVPKY